ncbi:Cysteine protease atg4 [Coemansia thaxteri]|uniref:Cysteine protease n=1 Tax=Coemansia thaxteri TaxID=2663907 RepID=A0A9W8EL70_9FUNG|nr:Cysteine protease atg4 [Coemansia thaxteri]KAJ2009659.1 Cysteine protease atg4 [Coemansia thaxteri]KAJ2487356.1 Cysteine protease atg4 [Coemansia sp. RSA 2320]
MTVVNDAEPRASPVAAAATTATAPLLEDAKASAGSSPCELGVHGLPAATGDSSDTSQPANPLPPSSPPQQQQQHQHQQQDSTERMPRLTIEGAPDLSLLRNQVVNTLREWYVLASDSIASMLEGRLLQEPAKDLWLLGKHYALAQQPDDSGWGTGYSADVLSDFSRLVWCTYRSQYPPISPSAFTTDVGWGCMLRAGQTLLAQALQLHYFGRDWGFSWDSVLGEDVRRRELYVGIVKQFFDDYSSSSIFSIHRMASLGKKVEGKAIGEWFGPYGTAAIIRELARQADHELSVYTTTDGVVYLADICEHDFKPTLILVASMLGIDRVNPVYYPFIQASLTLPQSAGVAGGRPSSALYFAGFQGDEVLYLDPHFTRTAVARRPDGNYTQLDLASYSCNTPRRIALSRLDPCMVFGYYCGTLEALIDLRSRIELLADDGMRTIMSFDNGHAPMAVLSAPSSSSQLPSNNTASDSPPSAVPGAIGSGLVVKLPPSSSESEDGCDSSSSSPSRPKSGSGEIVLEGECSEEEWVTDL